MDQLSSLGSQADIAVIGIAFMIGLGGSLHCVGMCGPLVSATTTNKFQSSLYQLGRLTGYLFIGTIVGLFGKIFLFRYSKDLNFFFSLLIALFFIFAGLKILVKRPLNFRMPLLIQKIWGKIQITKPSLGRAGLTGFFSIFLPCGFLYAVIFATISFQNLTLGLAAIFAFWLGTVPAMMSAPWLVHKLLKPLATRRPQFTGALLIALGLLTIVWRYQMTAEKCFFCH